MNAHTLKPKSGPRIKKLGGPTSAELESACALLQRNSCPSHERHCAAAINSLPLWQSVAAAYLPTALVASQYKHRSLFCWSPTRRVPSLQLTHFRPSHRMR